MRFSVALVALVAFWRESFAEIIVIAPANHSKEIDPIYDHDRQFPVIVPDDGVLGMVVVANPVNACSPISPPPGPRPDNASWFVLIERYPCTLGDKIYYAQKAGFDGAIIYEPPSFTRNNPSTVERILGPGSQRVSDDYEIRIYGCLVNAEDGARLKKFTYDKGYYVRWYPESAFSIYQYLIPFLILTLLCFLVILVFVLCQQVVRYMAERRQSRRVRLAKKYLKQLETKTWTKLDVQYDTCAICLEDYQEGHKLRILPCRHAFHRRCIDPWLTKNRRTCPCCKAKVRVPGMSADDDSSQEGADERRPLLSERDGPSTSYVTPLLHGNDEDSQNDDNDPIPPMSIGEFLRRPSESRSGGRPSGGHRSGNVVVPVVMSVNAEVSASAPSEVTCPQQHQQQQPAQRVRVKRMRKKRHRRNAESSSTSHINDDMGGPSSPLVAVTDMPRSSTNQRPPSTSSDEANAIA